MTSAVQDDEGRFVFGRVLPGDYYGAPVRWADVERRDLEVLQRIARTATPVRVLPNARVTVTLKRVP